jgi:RimJ/RimL family protein N-acetyltransferase
MNVLATDRLLLRWFRADDAAFIVALVNDPAWLRYIGDKNVRTLEDARRYLENGPIDMYARLGFGLYLVALKETGESVGMCGLIKRKELDDVDLGFAFLPQFRGLGFAIEACSAVLSYARTALGLTRVVAICSPDNRASTRVLEKLGFRREDRIKLNDDEALDFYAAA